MTQFDEALAAAIKLLERSDMFESELRGRLSAYDDDVKSLVIERLKSRHILDDRRLANSMANRRSGKKSIGFVRLEAELARRGADGELIQELRQSFCGGEGARQALAARFDPHIDDRAKAARFLASRGFEEDEIRSSIDEFFHAVSEFA